MDDVNGNTGCSRIKAENTNDSGNSIVKPVNSLIKPETESDLKPISWKKRHVYQAYQNNEIEKKCLPDQYILEIERAIQPLIQDRAKLVEISEVLQTLQ